MRSMWKGAISFGLVMIPVRLYAATEQKDISFRQVHRADGGRVRFRRFCSICGEEVPYEDVVKGYELPTGEMVVLDEEDMADLPLPTTKAIEVLQFAPAEQLDPILLNRSYYAEPDGAGARAYLLLRDALEQSGRIAIAQVALRQRESLATIRSRDGVLVVETLLWPDEVRLAEFPFLDAGIEVRPQELAMAASLIDSMTSDFDPDAYHDRYREALVELVESKMQGRELVQPGQLEIAAAQPVSLADALRASLAAAKEVPQAGENVRKSKAIGERAGPAKASVAAGTSKAKAAKADEARAGSAEAGPASTAAAKSGAGKAGAGKTGAGGTGAGGTGTSKTGNGRTGTGRTGTSKTGTSRTGAAKQAKTAKPGTAKPARKAS